MTKPASLRRMSETQQRRGLQPDSPAAGASAGAPLPLTPAELAHVSPSPSSSMADARAKASLAAAVPGLGLLPRAVVRRGSRGEGRVETQAGASREIDPLPPGKPAISALTETVSQIVSIPLRTIPGMNAREHWRAAAKRKKAEHSVVSWSLVHAFSRTDKPVPPLVVRLTRYSPSHTPLDDDNLAGSMKTVRDSVAAWLGIDDGDLCVRYENRQVTRAKGWCVRIEFVPIPTLTDEVKP